MISLITFLTIIVLSIMVVRIGAIALELTGLSSDIAAFQAQSAFSGVGFTTSESEGIVNHPVRRRIVRILILVGSAGITSSIATLVLTFMGRKGSDFLVRGGFLLLGLVVIILFAHSKYIHGVMKKIITKALERWTSLKLYDYESILGLSMGYIISRIAVTKDSWLAGKKLKELKLEREGLLVLSIYRLVDNKDRFIGIPTGETEIKAGDMLICYAREDVGKNISQRGKGSEGDKQHQELIKEEEKMSQIREMKGGFE